MSFPYSTMSLCQVNKKGELAERRVGIMAKECTVYWGGGLSLICPCPVWTHHTPRIIKHFYVNKKNKKFQGEVQKTSCLPSLWNNSILSDSQKNVSFFPSFPPSLPPAPSVCVGLRQDKNNKFLKSRGFLLHF